MTWDFHNSCQSDTLHRGKLLYLQRGAFYLSFLKITESGGGGGALLKVDHWATPHHLKEGQNSVPSRDSDSNASEKE